MENKNEFKKLDKADHKKMNVLSNILRTVGTGTVIAGVSVLLKKSKNAAGILKNFIKL